MSALFTGPFPNEPETNSEKYHTRNQFNGSTVFCLVNFYLLRTHLRNINTKNVCEVKADNSNKILEQKVIYKINREKVQS